MFKNVKFSIVFVSFAFSAPIICAPEEIVTDVIPAEMTFDDGGEPVVPHKQFPQLPKKQEPEVITPEAVQPEPTKTEEVEQVFSMSSEAEPGEEYSDVQDDFSDEDAAAMLREMGIEEPVLPESESHSEEN